MSRSFIIYITIVLFLFAENIICQDFDHFRYFPGHSEPDTAWKSKDFDDSSWLSGRGSIGYGDNDDSIVIAPVTSLYLRYDLGSINNFPADLKRTEGMVLDIDYDDGFVAFLNGKELFRINMEKSESPPLHNQITSRSHEATKYRWRDHGYRGFFIDSSYYFSQGLDTASILSFQVHNDSSAGSDLSFHLKLYFIYDTAWGDNEGDLTSFYYSYHAPFMPDSCKLPIVVIETDEFGFGDPYNSGDIYPHMGITDNEAGWNKPGDDYNGYNGMIRGHIRGSSSRQSPKLSYTIETQDPEGHNNNVPLLGMPEENDWVLYAPWYDKSLVRNELIYDLGRVMGYYEPRTRYCHLILNGEYAGLYVLTEKIKKDKNRVDISTLNPDEIYGNDITGGYIFRIDDVFEIIYPEPDIIAPQQYEYFMNFFDSCRQILFSNNFRDPVDGYRKYYDVSSMIDFILITEMTHNFDAYRKSSYFYKDRDDIDPKIYSGPLWDYDYTMRTDTFYFPPVGWNFYEDEFIGIRRFLQDTSFVNQMTRRWQYLRTGILEEDSLSRRIDTIIASIRGDIDLNYKVWPAFDKPILPFVDSLGTDYDNEIRRWKKWLEARMTWMDEDIVNILQPIPEYLVNETEEKSIRIFPNPCKDELNIRFNHNDAQDIRLFIYDISGKLLLREQMPATAEHKIQLPEEMKAGLYILEIRSKGMMVLRQKLVKE